MPEYLSPGVYIEEISIGPSPIEGVSTSTAGFIGYTERGPISPVLITSFEEYKRVFGNYIPESYLAYAIEGFFRNGGRRCYVAKACGKVKAPESVENQWTFAEKDLPCGDQAKITIKAVGPGAWGNRIFYRLTNSEIYNNEEVIEGVKEKDLYFNLTIFYCSKQPADEGLKEDYRKLSKMPYCTVEKYRDLCIKPSSPLYYKNQIEGISNFIRIFDNFAEMDETTLETTLMRPEGVTDVEEGSIKEDQDGMAAVLPIDTDAKGVNPKIEEPISTDFDGEEDVNLDNGKLIKTGFIAIANIEDVSILCVPDAINDEFSKNVIDECEKKANRFAILSTKQQANQIGSLEPIRDSKYAAQYFPWVYVFDPLSKSKKLVPPVGHLAGIYARVDNLRGVHKAPANETINGILSLQLETTTGKQDILNPKGINVIRSFPGRGYLVWGARTISRDPMWKYINVRRLFIFVEKSVERSTQWAVFEPNNERLWSRVKTSLEQFLVTVWKTGALMGTTPEEAFFVRVDRSTMTQNDVDNGRLVVVVGIAPTKPAEFVIFRFAQTQAGVKVTEI